MGDAIAHAVGSVPFAVSHVAWFAVWVLLNSRVLHGIEPFDPYPFNFLTLVVSLEAIFLSVFVLMSQNRLTRLSEVRAHLDLQVNLLAERELTTMLELQHAMCEKLGITVAKHRVRELLEDTDVQQLTKTLERNLPKA